MEYFATFKLEKNANSLETKKNWLINNGKFLSIHNRRDSYIRIKYFILDIYLHFQFVFIH